MSAAQFVRLINQTHCDDDDDDNSAISQIASADKGQGRMRAAVIPFAVPFIRNVRDPIDRPDRCKDHRSG